MRRNVRQVFVCAAVLLFATTAFAGEGPAKSEVEAQAAPKLESRVFQLKSRSAVGILQVLEPLRSQTFGTAIAANDEAHAISVRDLPANLAAIDDAIRRLDTPKSASADVEVKVYILLSADGAAPAVVPELGPVFARLRRSVGDRSYELLAPVVQRTRVDAESGIMCVGQAATGDSTASYSVIADHISQSADPADPSRVNIRNFQFELKAEGGDASIASGLTVRLGEPAIVGVASLPHGKSVALVMIVDAAGK